MITHTILVHPKSATSDEELRQVLMSVHTIRRLGHGIADIRFGTCSHPEYTYGVYIRFNKSDDYDFSISKRRNKAYASFVSKLELLCDSILAFDLKDEDISFREVQQAVGSSFAFGLFTPSVEERLRELVRLYLRSDGRTITHTTVLGWDKSDTESAPASLDELLFDIHVAQEFGFDFGTNQEMDDFLGMSFTFADVLRFVQEHLS